MGGDCKCKCNSCGHEMAMEGDSCGMCCDAPMEKVCEHDMHDHDMDEAEEESENGGGCCGSCH